MSLYSKQSLRLYLNRSEREVFRQLLENLDGEEKFLGLVLFYTGCRVSEALSLTKPDIQVEEGIIAIRSLKKRGVVHVREIPVPKQFAQELSKGAKQGTLFHMSRTTAWRKITRLMEMAGITGDHATPKGLRHSFGMWCAYNSIPITLCQKWMGHADIRTTAIYYQIVGKEEREMAERMW